MNALMKTLGDVAFVALGLYLLYAVARSGFEFIDAQIRHRAARRDRERRRCDECGNDHDGRCSPRGE